MKKTNLLFLALFSVASLASAVEKLPPIPHLHPSVIQGQLPNGLRYLIKPIAPQAGQASEVELRLLVNSGSLGEANDERGVAHLIEHMAFRQTKNFGKDEVKGLFNSNGMRWGNDSNAYTNIESTNYFFKVKPETLDRGLQLMADWANGDIVFDAEELNTERGVVLDEINLRKDNQQGWGNFYSVLIPHSPHLDRLPGGFEQDVRDLPPERIEALYRKLYQPQKMTLVVAGDVPKNIEQTIKTLFAKAPMGDQASQYPALPLTPKVRSYRASPPPWPHTEFGITWNFIQQPATDAAQLHLQYIAMQAMQQRLQKLASKDEQHFSSAQWFDESGVAGRERYFSLYTIVKNEKLGDGLTQLYREVRRARETGFSDAEVADAIASFALVLKNMSVSNETWANSLIRSAKFGIPALYVAEQKAIFDPATITPQAVNAAWQSVVTTPDQIAMILRPKDSSSRTDGDTWHDEKLAAMIAAVDAETLPAQVAQADKPLMSEQPARGQIVQTQTERGVTVWTLSNGAQVLVRTQRQADERIGVNGRFAGGALALPKEWRFVSQILPNYMMQAGVGDLNTAQLIQAIRNEELQLQPIFETAQHGFGGGAATRSFEPLMQLIYLSLAQPRSDNTAREKATTQAYQSYWPNGPGFNQNLFGAAWPYRAWGSVSDFAISTEKLDQLRAQLFGNPAQLRMVLTGVADLAQAKDLVERYIASIPPAKPTAVTLLPSKIEPKVQSLSNTVLSERLKESLKTFTFHDDKYTVWSVALEGVAANTQNAFLQEGLNDVIKQRLLTTLREQAGDSYTVNAWGEMSQYFGPTLGLEYSVTREKCGQALVLAAQELRKLSQNSVTDTELKAMHEFMQKGLDNGPKYPYWYAYSQMFHWVYNHDLSWVNPKPEQILTRANVDAAAKSWFVPEKWIVAADACKTLPDLTVLDQTVTAASH
ncbi:M16 family metallopeptidase [Deefgea salmonis]|uniref:Insulinase family protein n=1 Tax=Deefgea salmonis TaxID=2875502 RepID=A0ABS8BIA6_9NEIS|nr:M16 family metallopeptidase [Deefgea salmonis]MCB5195450.1 insulinase family protein [Deefgea salmonis]